MAALLAVIVMGMTRIHQKGNFKFQRSHICILRKNVFVQPNAI